MEAQLLQDGRVSLEAKVPETFISEIARISAEDVLDPRGVIHQIRTDPRFEEEWRVLQAYFGSKAFDLGLRRCVSETPQFQGDTDLYDRFVEKLSDPARREGLIALIPRLAQVILEGAAKDLNGSDSTSLRFKYAQPIPRTSIPSAPSSKRSLGSNRPEFWRRSFLSTW